MQFIMLRNRKNWFKIYFLSSIFSSAAARTSQSLLYTFSIYLIACQDKGWRESAEADREAVGDGGGSE